MPELSRFYGIVIMMYADDHNPPHIHAKYGENIAQFDIRTGEKTHGEFPNRAATMVHDWIAINRDDLMVIWETQRFRKLNPLD